MLRDKNRAQNINVRLINGNLEIADEQYTLSDVHNVKVVTKSVNGVAFSAMVLRVASGFLMVLLVAVSIWGKIDPSSEYNITLSIVVLLLLELSLKGVSAQALNVVVRISSAYGTTDVLKSNDIVYAYMVAAQIRKLLRTVHTEAT